MCSLVSALLQPSLSSQWDEWVLSRYRHMHEVNNRRCRRQPVYGKDLIKTVQSFCNHQPASSSSSSSPPHWLWVGHATCKLQQTMAAWQRLLIGSDTLAAILPSYEDRLLEMTDTLKRYIVYMYISMYWVYAQVPQPNHIQYHSCASLQSLASGLRAAHKRSCVHASGLQCARTCDSTYTLLAR